jgi:hypothetical protein
LVRPHIQGQECEGRYVEYVGRRITWRPSCQT